MVICGAKPGVCVWTRGHSSVQAKWVKGHATDEMLENGTVRLEDKRRNDRADKLADRGIDM